jgi:peptidoglycan hydrolase-like protein with peptidoglycan-binding domain
MRRAYLSLALLIWLASRCSHTETVERHDPAPPAQRDRASDEAEKARATPERDPAPPRKAADDDGADHDDAPPLASSPGGLLQPGAAAALQDKLIARGYLEASVRSGRLDAKTQKALREFQREQGMPATGAPDDLTVEKLGLSPGEVFRSAGDAKR